MKIIRSGRIFYLHLDCPDIEGGLLRRVCRRLGMVYTPFTLRFYDRLYLREDHSKYNRALVEACKKWGVETIVVQEGYGKGSGSGHLPLHADRFLCPLDCKQWWIDKGMPKERIVVYQREPDKFKNIFFLRPLYTRDDFLHRLWIERSNAETMKEIERYLDLDVVFKLHPKNRSVMEHFIPKYRIVTGEANELILKYDKVYCFEGSSIIIDCKMLGKEAVCV